nr:immunoglobulin heavy chain junction region [Mus musculus]
CAKSPDGNYPFAYW